jgi:orotidine-5'-phosphate decarboxylase
MKKVYIALDMVKPSQISRLIACTPHEIFGFKVGLELFISEGNKLIDRLDKAGFAVFLDLKLYDIPNTVAQAVEKIIELPVEVFTVHASGGVAMLSAARDKLASKSGAAAPKMLGVTVLTSMNSEQFKQFCYISESIERTVLCLAELAAAHCDGVVASAVDAPRLRQENFQGLIVSPGIRLAGEKHNDQARVMTPKQAFANGVNSLVVGRPITQALDLAAALEKWALALESD